MLQTRPERWGVNALLLTASLALAPHASRLPLWMLLVCAGALVWRFGTENRGWPVPGWLLRLTIT
ncbi:MAG: hypothetical protein ACE5K1_06175, partial [Acidiferrobacterales bacterium]